MGEINLWWLIVLVPFGMLISYVLIFWIIYLPLKFFYEHLAPYPKLEGSVSFLNSTPDFILTNKNKPTGEH